MEKTTRNTIAAIIVGIMIVILAIMISLLLNLNLVENLVMSWVLTTFYAVFALFMVGDVKVYPVRTEIRQFPFPIRVPVEKPIIKEVEIPFPIRVPVEKEVIKEVEVPFPIQIPVENKVIEVVERQVSPDVVCIHKPVKTVYVERPRKKLNIPKYAYLASTETKTFHKRTCRLSKLIKRKYKDSSNTKNRFLHKGYRPCKVCI
jgi:hypothetical protein